MRILLITSYFPPETGSAANLFHELGTALTQRGHEVTVVTAMPTYHAEGDLGAYRGRLWMSERKDGMTVLRATTPQLSRQSRIGRGIWQFACAAALLTRSLSARKHDIAIVYSPPLPLALAAWGLKLLRGTPFILNVQDLFPQSAIDLRLLTNRRLICAFEKLEAFLYRRAALVTVHSPGNREHVCAKADSCRVEVLENWVDTDKVYLGPRLNGFSHANGLDGKFVALFGGIIGYSQDMDVILGAADRLRAFEDLVFLIVGDGADKARAIHQAAEMGLTSVRFLPMRARHEYLKVLHGSDVCLVTLREDVETPVVPSKIITAMAGARPVVAAMNLEGDAPKLLAEANCGICCKAGNADSLAAALLRLYQNPELAREMGRSGRRYAERVFSLSRAADKYEELIRLAMGQAPVEGVPEEIPFAFGRRNGDPA